MKEYYHISQVMTKLKLHESTLNDLVSRGIIRTIRQDGAVYFNKNDVKKIERTLL